MHYRGNRGFVRSSIRPGFSRFGGDYGRVFDTRGVYRPELKSHDVSFGPVQASGTLLAGLNVLVAGVAPTQVVGRRITIKSLQVKAVLRKDASSNVNPTLIVANDCVKMVLVLDTQANGAYPLWSDIFASTTYTSYLNLRNANRFQILKEWDVTMRNSGVAWDGTVYTVVESVHCINHYKKVNIRIDFSISPTGVITEIRSNNVFLMAISQQGSVNISGRTRIRYLDA